MHNAQGRGRGLDPIGEDILVNAAFEKDGAYVIARTQVKRATPILPSHTPYYPGADRPERHIQDMLGVAFTDHPDARRWTRHQAWTDSEYPLRKDFPAAGRVTVVHPAGRYLQIPLRPGCGRIRNPRRSGARRHHRAGAFSLPGGGRDRAQPRGALGLTHKGIEKIAEGRDPEGLARLAGRVSGDTTVAHTWAACMAMEKAGGVAVPRARSRCAP